MDFQSLIKTRISIRSFDPDRPVEKEALERILNAGRLAPSAANRQPWRFVIVTSQEKLTLIRTCYNRPWLKDAPHILVVTGNREEAWKRSDNYSAIETDLAIAMDHMILAATEEGIGTCWIAAFDYKLLHETLNLSAQECVFAITPLGYPPESYAKTINKQRKPLEEIVRFI